MAVVSNHVSEQFCLSALDVRAGDVTTVARAFGEVEPELLLDVVLGAEAGWKMPAYLMDDFARETLCARIRSVLGAMRAIEPQPRASKPAQLIVPWQRFACIGPEGDIRRFVEAAIVNFEDIPCAKRVIGRYGDRMETLVKYDAVLARHAEEDPVGELEASGMICGIEEMAGSAWADVLGYGIWLPASLTERERYLIMGSVFWVMTYEGFAPGIGGAVEEGVPGSKRKRYRTFLIEYAERLSRFVDMLNYNSWAESVYAMDSVRDVLAA